MAEKMAVQRVDSSAASMAGGSADLTVAYLAAR